MDRDEAGANTTGHRQGAAGASDPSRGPVARGAGGQEPSEKVKAAARPASARASEVEPAPQPRAKAKAKAKPKPEVVVKRLRRDERFYMGGQECQTPEQLIAAFARKLLFPAGWTPDWACFERCMLDLTWLQQPWPPRRICALEMHDADYLLARGSDSDLVAFVTIIELASRHSRLPFKFEALFGKEEPLRRIEAALSVALRDLGLDGATESSVPTR